MLKLSLMTATIFLMNELLLPIKILEITNYFKVVVSAISASIMLLFFSVEVNLQSVFVFMGSVLLLSIVIWMARKIRKNWPSHSIIPSFTINRRLISNLTGWLF